jgi:hypothetical protein
MDVFGMWGNGIVIRDLRGSLFHDLFHHSPWTTWGKTQKHSPG